MSNGFGFALGACFRGRAGRGWTTGVPSALIPTARRTEGRKLETEIVCAVEPCCVPPGLPTPPWNATSRARRSLTLAVVAVEMIGSPIVTQRIATRGSARRIGKARERVRAMERADGSRRGRST
jgi:hypothetical protein